MTEQHGRASARRPYHSPARQRQAEQTRAGILAAVGPPHDLVDRLRAATDPRQRLRLVAELSRRAYEASVPEFELMRGAAVIAPEIAAAADQVESRRRGNQTRLVAY